jgi:hypothetical protein
MSTTPTTKPCAVPLLELQRYIHLFPSANPLTYRLVLQWGLFAATLGVFAYLYSPIYRKLTIQYKTFLQLSTMTIGAAIEGDKRLRAYELYLRQAYRQQRAAHQKQLAKEQFDQAMTKMEREEDAREKALGKKPG